MMANPSCLRLLTHWERRAASRAAWTAGRSSAIKTAMIAMTTNNSIKVKPRLTTRMMTCLRWFRGEEKGFFLGYERKRDR